MWGPKWLDTDRLTVVRSWLVFIRTDRGKPPHVSRQRGEFSHGTYRGFAAQTRQSVYAALAANIADHWSEREVILPYFVLVYAA